MNLTSFSINPNGLRLSISKYLIAILTLSSSLDAIGYAPNDLDGSPASDSTSSPLLASSGPEVDCNRMRDFSKPALNRGIFLEPYTRINIGQWGEIEMDPTQAAIGAVPVMQTNTGDNVEAISFGFTEFALRPLLRFKPTITGVFRITVPHKCSYVYDSHTIEVVGPNVTYPVMVPAYNTVEMASKMNGAFNNRNAFGLAMFQYLNQDGGHAVMSIDSSLVEPLKTSWRIPLTAPFIFQLSNASVSIGGFTNSFFGRAAYCFDPQYGGAFYTYVNICAHYALQNQLFLGPSLNLYNTLWADGPMAQSPGLAYGFQAVGGHNEGAASGSEIGALNAAAYAISFLPFDAGYAMFKKAILSTWLSETLRRSQVRAVASGNLSDIYHISLDRDFDFNKIEELALQTSAQNLPVQMRGVISDIETNILDRNISPESTSAYKNIFGISKVDVNTPLYSVLTLNPLDDVLSFTVDLQNSFIPNPDGSEDHSISNWSWEVHETEDSIQTYEKNIENLGHGLYRINLSRNDMAMLLGSSTPGGRITFAFIARDTNQRPVPPYFVNVYQEYSTKATNNYELQYIGAQTFPSLFERIRVSGLTSIPLSRVIVLNNSNGDFSGSIISHSYYGPSGYQNSVMTWIDRGANSTLSKTERPIYGQPNEVTFRTVQIANKTATIATSDTSERPEPEIMYTPLNHSHLIIDRSKCGPTEFKWFVEHTTLPRSQVTFQYVDTGYKSRVKIFNEDLIRKVIFDTSELNRGKYELKFSISDGVSNIISKLTVNLLAQCKSMILPPILPRLPNTN